MSDLTKNYSTQDAERILIADDPGRLSDLRRELVVRVQDLEASSGPKQERIAAIRLAHMWLARTKAKLTPSARDRAFTHHGKELDIQEIKKQNDEILRILRSDIDRQILRFVRKHEVQFIFAIAREYPDLFDGFLAALGTDRKKFTTELETSINERTDLAAQVKP